jgi:hypothetical protein
MLKGMDVIKEKTQEAQASSGKNRVRWLQIKEGEVALLRFLTDKEDIIQAEMHSAKKITPKGEYYIKVYCKMQDNQPCEHCAGGLSKGPMYFLWAYVYEIFHKAQNPKLAQYPDADKWERVTVKDVPYYKETVNGPMIFRTGPGKDQKYKNMLVNFSDEYGTLCDRDYKWLRTGGSKETTDYSLISKDPKKITKEVVEVRDSIPELGDVVSGKVNSLSSEENTSETEKEATAPAEDDLF